MGRRKAWHAWSLHKTKTMSTPASERSPRPGMPAGTVLAIPMQMPRFCAKPSRTTMGSTPIGSCAAIQGQLHINALRGSTIAIRNDFTESLRSLGLCPLPSQGNFVLVRFQSPAAVASADAHLRADAIVVRGMNGYGLPDCLRITKRVLDSLQEWVDAQ